MKIRLSSGSFTRPLFVRISHWLNAGALLIMIGSGWGIYNASPMFFFSFPRHLTLGGWLPGSLAWHFAAMWLLMINTFLYISIGLASGYFRRQLLPVSRAAITHDFHLAVTGGLVHEPGRYNAIQRLLYVLVLLGIVGAFLSGLAIWKPIQLAPLCNLLGGYEFARRVHFVMMTGIALFIGLHVAMVAKYPRTLRPMLVG